MQKRYLDQVENLKFTHKSTSGIILRVLEGVQLILIIVYCSLSRSLQSATALIFLLSCIALTLNKMYIYDKKNQVLLGNFTNEYLQPRQTRRILWGVFLLVQLIFTLFKTVYFIAGNITLSVQMQEALQVQSAVYAFVPCVFLGTTPALLFLKHRRKPLQAFKIPISKLVVVIMHTLLIILLILIQFLNVCLLSLFLVLIVAGLNMGKSWSFNNKRWLILTTVFFTAGWIIAMYICFFEVVKINPVVGSIIGLEMPFPLPGQKIAFIVCLGLTYLFAVWMSRLYSYEKVRKRFSEDRQKFLMHKHHQSGSDDHQLSEGDEPNEDLKDDMLEQELQNAISKRQKINSKQIPMDELKQLQLISRQDVRSKSFTGPMIGPDSERRSLALEFRKHTSSHQKSVHQSIYEPKHKSNVEVPNEANEVFDVPEPKKTTNWTQSVMDVLKKIRSVLMSVHFNFRLLQLVSIVLIQRYNTIYSILLIIWLLLSSVFTRIVFLRYSTIILVLPATMFNYFPLYYSNVNGSPLPSNCGTFPCSVYGFMKWNENDIWVDVIIFNFYIYLLLTFLKITTGEIFLQLRRRLRQMRRKKKGQKTKTTEVSYWKILLAFMFKQTYLATLIIIFIIGFSSVNLIHLGFSLLFLIFFALGEQIIIRTTNINGKSINVVSTFSQKYWIYIVNYTGLIIFLKYLYFLLFSEYNPEWLPLTGISKQYDTTVNFSLVSYCQSNTTYLFVIYILAALQLEVCRSDIYKQISIDLTYFISQKPFFRQRWGTISRILEICNILYYQCMFFVAAIIVLLLNSRWSINGIIIAIAITYGVVYGFGLGRLWVIAMWSNLSFIAINYLLMFISFDFIKTAIGQSLEQQIADYSELLGFFKLKQNSLQLTFLRNIIIYLATVQCQKLYGILVSKRLYPPQQHSTDHSNEPPTGKLSQQMRDPSEKSQSKISSVDLNLNTNRNNDKFAELYLQNVILMTCYYYEKNLADYKIIRKIQSFFAFIITDLSLLFVIICSLYFRLSISMGVFLTIYLLHLLLQFRQTTQILKSTGYLILLEKHIKKFELKVDILYSDAPLPAYQNTETFQEFQEMIEANKLRIMVLKHAHRKHTWPYAALMSFLCLLLTYSLQIITRDFCQDSCSQTVYIIQKILFIVGISTTNGTNLWREIYFYFFMIFIVMAQRYLLVFTDNEMNKQQSAISKPSSEIKKPVPPSLLNIREVAQDEEEIFNKLRKPTPQQYSLFEPTINIIQTKLYKPSQQKIQPLEQQIDEQVVKQANLVFFYQFSSAYIKIKSIYGILGILLRFYISLLLINCSQKSNIFSWIYLIIAGMFWVKTIRFEMVEYINRISIIILLIQYIMLLTNINPNSPYYVGQYAPYSLIGKVLTNQSWLSYLAFGGVPDNNLRNSNENVSFLINSIIIFATEYYFSLFYAVTLYTLSTFKALKAKYQHIVQELLHVKKTGKKLYISYENYKSFSYRFLRKMYETITIHYHIILSLIILMIVFSFTTAVSIGLMIMAALYFCLIIFTSKSTDASSGQKVQRYTYIYFYLCKVVSFLQLLFLTIFHIPTLLNQCSNPNTSIVLLKVCNQIKIMSITGDLFLLFFVQLWFDMYESPEYKRFVKVYKKSNQFMRNLSTKCYVYRLNDQRLKDMFQQYQEIINFQTQVDVAMQAIEEWHKIMRKEVDNTEYRNELDRLKEFQRTIKLEFHEDGSDAAGNYTKDSITHKLFDICKRLMNHTLYQSVPTLVSELKNYNSRVFSDVNVTCHDFVTENFEELEARLEQLDMYYKNLYERIKACDKTSYQELLKNEIENLPLAKANNSVMLMPSLVQIKQQKPNLTILQILLILFASRFDDVVLFFILMYYMVNPCLASLPIIIMILSYEIIAEIKRKNWLLIYIVLLIATTQIVQEYMILNPNKPAPAFYSWFFFSRTQLPSFSTAYLEFLLVLVLLNQLLKIWIGLADKEPLQIQNQYQALVRCQINSSVDIQKSVDVKDQSKNDEDAVSVDVPVSVHKVKMQVEQQIVKKAIIRVELDEKDRNPYEVCIEQLENKSSLILDEEANLGFFKKLRLMRDGIDLYPYLAAVQIMSIIYLIIFYPIMQNTDDSLGPTKLDSNKFSTPLIISVFTYVVVAVIERFIATMAYERGKKQYVKYAYTMLILSVICFEAYYLAPYDSSSVQISYIPTPALLGFMFLQFLYFIASALQVKWGYKKYKRLNSMLHKRTYVNDMITSVFTAIPFLYELKLIMDWSFSTTGLTLQNWIRHFNIYLISFQSTITSMTNKKYKLGSPVPVITKVLFGWCGFILILLLIFGPMILFSGLNPVSQSNLAIGGQLQIGIQIKNSNYFQLYSTSHFSQPPTPINQTQFDQLGFWQIPLLESLDENDLQQQFEMINYFPYSDNLWEISTPNYQLLLNTINQTLEQINQNQQPQYEFFMTVNYEFTRNISTTVSSPAQFNYPFINDSQVINSTTSILSLSYDELVSLNSTLTMCSSPTTFTNFYIALIKLDTSGSSFKPKPIIKNGSDDLPLYIQNVTMSLICNKNNSQYTNSASSLYWQVTLNDQFNAGLVMYVLCDKYTALNFGFTFIGLYTSIILVIANFLRGFFTGDISLVPYNHNPRPESILCICEAIEVVRMRHNLREEVLLYYQLIDIMRSPEIIKYMCGNYSRFIKENDEKKAELEQAQRKHSKGD